MKRCRAQPEAALQRQVWAHIRTRSAGRSFCFHVPNGAKRDRITGAILQGLDARAGVPDIVCIRAGRACFLELKSERGRLSKVQRETIDELKAAGAVVAVADNLDDALDKLELWGVLKGRVQ
jgi:hypothetical protein